jgi:hypothetical protein
MADKQRLERAVTADPPWWSSLAYWVCWVGLALVAVYAVAGRD